MDLAAQGGGAESSTAVTDAHSRRAGAQLPGGPLDDSVCPCPLVFRTRATFSSALRTSPARGSPAVLPTREAQLADDKMQGWGQ